MCVARLDFALLLRSSADHLQPSFIFIISCCSLYKIIFRSIHNRPAQQTDHSPIVLHSIIGFGTILHYNRLMLVINKTKEEGFFGKHQRAVALIVFAIAQLMLHGPIFVLLYAILTLDLYFFLGLLVIVIVQLPIRRSQTFIDLVNKYVLPFKYFDKYEITYEEIITQQDRCIFGVHPHSVIGLSLLMLMNSVKEGPFSTIIGLGSRFALNFPFTGAILKMWGVQAVNHKNLKKLMKEGKNLGLVPGGYQEATLTTPDEVRLWINNRKGFIKYSLEHGYTIYPVIMMNEHKAYSMFESFLNFRLFLNKLKLPGVLFWNKWTGILLPPWLDLHVIIGKGIKKVVGSEGVTQALIDETHNAYIQEILRIYEKYAHLNGNTPIKVY